MTKILLVTNEAQPNSGPLPPHAGKVGMGEIRFRAQGRGSFRLSQRRDQRLRFVGNQVAR